MVHKLDVGLEVMMVSFPELGVSRYESWG